MSRYSKILLRAKDNLSPSGEPSASSAGPSHTEVSNTGPSNEPSYPKASSRPHPYRYQLGAFHTPTNLEPNNFEINSLPIVQIPRDTSASNHASEKPLTNAIGHPQVRPQLPPRATSRHHQAPLSLRLPPLVPLIFLPIPPLLSLLYMTAGHALLRRTQKSSTSIYHTPIQSSIEAGATGGAILSLPIALLLYLFISLNRQPSVPEDFFEDDDSITGSARWMIYVGYVVCILLLVGIGGVAGPLGVTCLSSPEMLSTRAAAAAGFVGGAVLSVGILLLGLLIAVVWSFCMRRNNYHDHT